MRYWFMLVVAILSTALYLALDFKFQEQQQMQNKAVAASVYARQFLSYRSAVMAYMTANPGFTGTITASQLQALGGQQFSSTFLAQTGNAETAWPGGGIQVTVYSSLPGGALAQVLTQSEGDASIGVSAGATWTTAAAGVTATPQPLAVPVPSGDVVSVFVMEL